MRKPLEDPIARTVAEHHLGDALESTGMIDSTAHEPAEVGRAVLSELAGIGAYIEFETTKSKVRGGQEIPLRRLVITGDWEIDPNAVKISYQPPAAGGTP